MHNILLIHGDASGAEAICKLLIGSTEWKFQVDWVATGAGGAERLKRLGNQNARSPHGIAGVVVDLRLPDVSGINTFNMLFAAAAHIPVVLLCSDHDKAIAILAVRSGAGDYLLKHQINKYSLPRAVAGVIDRAVFVEALSEEKERAQITLNSIGDAVISVDFDARVTYLNAVAEQMTGWVQKEAIGLSLDQVLALVDSHTRVKLANPLLAAMQHDKHVTLPPNSSLMRRDGSETPVEDSTAPIHDRQGRVIGAVMVFHDVSETRALAVKLAYLAQHDSLTDLPNRSVLNDRLTQAITIARRSHTSVAILYMDLDRFKSINDSLGHAIGDRLLQSVALRLSACVREADTVCRVGGDEFVILLSGATEAQEAVVCAEKALHAINNTYLIDDYEVHVSASVGIVIYPDDGTEVEVLLRNGDSAMYEAKNRGRNQYQFYRTELNAGVTARLALENDLRHAIERRELELHYQSNIDLVSGVIAGAEALVRWRHPIFGLLMPSKFLPIAEESGLIVSIGRWILHEACRQTKAWADARLPLFRLAVNISAVELRSPAFVDGVRTILTETGFDPRRLELEITETFLMQDTKSTGVVLQALKDLGIQLALDDFGTGYSSLSYMRRFPIDALKVDQSFVRHVTTEASDASVVRAVINMGTSLRMRVIAEGVESREQLAFLKMHSCTEAQGFLFSHPLPPIEFSCLLSKEVDAGGNVPTTGSRWST